MASGDEPPRYGVEISRRTEKDLDDIAAVIAQDSPVKAVRFVAKIRARIRTLQSFPQRGHEARERADGERLLEVIEPPYRILYVIHGRVVRVLHIRHHRRRSFTH